MLSKYIIILCLVLKCLANFNILDSEIEYQCVQNCPLQNRTDMGHYDYACDYNCNIEQCAKGCRLWRMALNMSCQSVCNGGILTPKELYCVMGCNDAVTKYFSQLRIQLGTPPAPALVADSLQSTSLKLEWNFPEAKKAGLDCHIQWKYEELSASWQYCRNTTWDNQNSIVSINNLQPYTKYKFRVVMLLRHYGELIVSPSSVVISTLPSGVPQSPPIIVRAAAVDHSSISVSWEPGPFPHGPLLSYVLQITDNNPEGHSQVKDIPPENTYTIIRTLSPSSDYTISVTMRNNVGSGPAAKVSVSTPPEPTVRTTEQPVLILGTENSIIQQGVHIVDEPIFLYRTKARIKGVGIHISKKLLFISDSKGNVLKMPLKQNEFDKKFILTPKNIDFLPLDLSVDWLNNYLYILGEIHGKYIIKRCSLNGDNLTVAYAGLRVKPSTMEIDPYNGYLFWTIQDQLIGGLYRLDISDISNGVKYEVKVDRILNETNLGSFIIDHANFRLLVSYQKQNTINAVSLDGKEVTDLRSKVTNSKLRKVISLATANNKFYWTDGDDVFYEEYHHSYFHNSYPGLSLKGYKKVLVNLQSSQPTPIPLNPPTNVQAIFGNNIAKAKWSSPHLLGVQSKGAWQNWSYELWVKDTNSKIVKYYKNITDQSFTIYDLDYNSEYLIKAAAYTSSGKGPWSSEFRGSTLDFSNKPMILWSAAEGLLSSNAAGEGVDTILHKSRMKNFYFTDLSWYNDQIYLVTNSSYVHWYNLNSHEQGTLIDLDSVGSIAIDWIGMKLYWSNPKQQLILRGNMNGTQQEPLPILTLAKELNIDSIKAYLYWSTGYAVECAHLNGVDRMEYHHAKLFSGKQVMGLTLDVDKKFVYWIVRGSEGSTLFKSQMQGYSTKNNQFTVEKISILQKPNMQGSLCYFHNRLLWLQDDKNAAISDLSGTNIAIINGKSIYGLNMVYVVDTSLHPFPENRTIDDIIVTPTTINKTSIQVTGSSDSFNITWQPVENVNYGTVFYEVQIGSFSRNESIRVTTFPSIKYWQEVTPFTKLHITIRAYTYWATSPQIHTKIYSPPSTPSAPMNLRTFITNDGTQLVTFRWDPPMYPNGVLQGYKINCWHIENDTKIPIVSDLIQNSNITQYVLKNLTENKNYFMQVQAFTEIGDGVLSQTISVDTNDKLPLPTLLISSNTGIFIYDIDANKNTTLLNGIFTPIGLASLINENKILWINDLNELCIYNLNTKSSTKIIDLEGVPNGITIDWIERSIYYTDIKDDKTQIYKVDLNHVENDILRIIKLFTIDAIVVQIEISPFTRKFYWIETNDKNNFNLMESYVDGTEKKLFFNSSTVNVGKTFSLDHFPNKSVPNLIYFDVNEENIVSVDIYGYNSEIIANKSIISDSLPIDKLKSDIGSLYWLNSGSLYALNKRESTVLIKHKNIDHFIIFGKHIQPYTTKKCLIPQQIYNTEIILLSKTSNSLKFKMPPYSIEDNCGNISISTVQYTLLYTEEKLNIDCTLNNCDKVKSFEKIIEINNLKSFTNYKVSVIVSNYFSQADDMRISESFTFRTAPGAPSMPQNVTAVILNPTLAKVSWLPPQQLNGIIVHYEIHWQTEGTLSGIRQKGEQPVPSNNLTTLIHKLSPNETYTIWVRAYSESNETSTDSERIEITTFSEPSNLILLNKTANSLKLNWIIAPYIVKYSVEYSAITSNHWRVIEDLEFNGNESSVTVNVYNLLPKSQYKFRIKLLYEKYPELYIWPTDSRFTYETLGDRPSPPGTPIIQYVKPNIYKVWWETAKDNGSPIELYMLEGLKLYNYRDKRSTNRSAWYYTAPSIDEEEREWQMFYNGTNTSWIIDGLNDKYKYVFRVLAMNAYGWSDPSMESNEFDIYEAARMAEKQNPIFLISIAISTPITIVAGIILFYCICTGKCRKQKKVPVSAIPRGPDVELATLREMPRLGIRSTNILYVSAQPTPEDLMLLPQIKRDHIKLIQFLGSGAFGEVYEGRARGISGSNDEITVAVKTQRKGASEQERTEFLQEAQLMSHFKHEHILQLLGVCLDNDSIFIIMELMRGGDLLTYLRSSRTPTSSRPMLTLIELLKMCVDVSKGCRYLEEMHFVHRDLACRNCLVSSVESDTRIVKIGDFGLARDIYKNDYYRKEGEGLLPVRWMSPESLVDGVFTSQSDVWAFGVLLWEIMTLGQQPYPARNNMEVLHYVRGGGRLGKPTDCPEELYSLMLQCWEFDPDRRPTFKYCLEVLEILHNSQTRNPLTSAHQGPYISTVSGNETWKQENVEEAVKEKTPFLPPQTTTPQYLELLYEPNSTTNDGYEIPSTIVQPSIR